MYGVVSHPHGVVCRPQPSLLGLSSHGSGSGCPSPSIPGASRSNGGYLSPIAWRDDPGVGRVLGSGDAQDPLAHLGCHVVGIAGDAPEAACLDEDTKAMCIWE